MLIDVLLPPISTKAIVPFSFLPNKRAMATVSNSNPFKKNMIDGTHFKVNKNYTIVAKYEKTRNNWNKICLSFAYSYTKIFY